MLGEMLFLANVGVEAFCWDCHQKKRRLTMSPQRA